MREPRPELSRLQQMRSLGAIIATVTVVGLSLGFTIPLVSLALEQRGASGAVIGMSTTVQFFALLCAAPLTPRLLGRFGAVPLMTAAIAVSAATTLLFPLLDHGGIWFALRFILGAATAVLFVSGETWINQRLHDRVRGRVLGLYGSILAAGIAIGPLAIRFTGIDGVLPFAVAAAMVLAAALPLSAAIGLAPQIGGHAGGSPLLLARAAPVVAAAALAFGAIDAATLGLLPVFGLRNGLAAAPAAELLSVFLIGAVVCQLPIGWAADLVRRRRLLIACGGLAGAGFVLLPWAFGASPLLTLAVLFVTGGAVGGLYTLALVLIGERFRGPALAQANAAIVMLYGVGSVVGPAFTGAAMEADPRFGLPLSLALICAAILAVGLRPRSWGR